MAEELNSYKQREIVKNEVTTKVVFTTAVGSSRVTTWNLDTDVSDPENYRKVLKILREANETDKVIVHISSWGGYLDTAVLLVNALLATKAKTKAIIHTAASAATFIAFACDEIETSDFSTIMIHNFSVSQHGKGKEVRAKAEFDKKQFAIFCEILYNGVISEEEMAMVQDDDDIWMLGKELKERLVLHGRPNKRPLAGT